MYIDFKCCSVPAGIFRGNYYTSNNEASRLPPSMQACSTLGANRQARTNAIRPRIALFGCWCSAHPARLSKAGNRLDVQACHDANTLPTSARKTVAELKADLLRAVSFQRRPVGGAAEAKRRILEAVNALEEQGDEVSAEISGRWTLVYSMQAADQEVNTIWDNNLVQAATNILYKIFFKVAPALAGSQETGGASNVRNEQLIDMDSSSVNNIVDVQLPGKQNIKLRIRVWGEVSADAEAKNKLHVTFTGWGFAIVRDQQVGREMQLPLPRPRGTLNTTFCDDTLRVSRGGRGGLFITNRAPSSH